MCRHIGHEIMIANALIEVIERDMGKKIELTKLQEYCYKCMTDLEDNYPIVLFGLGISHQEYTDFFNLVEENHTRYIELGSTKTVTDLRIRFRRILEMETYEIFIVEENLKILGIVD